MVVLQHKHSLSLIDLNPKYPQNEKVYDDDEELIIKQAFQYPCARCEKNITYFHRYYYRCDQCDYSLHKLCDQYPTKLLHASHSAHSLTLFPDKSLFFLDKSQGQCHMCKRNPIYWRLRYHCSRCMFTICLDCAMGEIQYHTIYHPSHQHPLVPICRQREILSECDACGKEHKGVFYECSTCYHFLIHNDCIFQQNRLLIQDGTCGRFSHTHPLVLSYSFPTVDQKAKFDPTCKVCDNSFSGHENHWIYKCEKCRYYAHADCANSIYIPPTRINRNCKLGDILKMFKYYEEHIKEMSMVLDFPLPNLSYNLFTDLFSKESNYEMTITHKSHDHPLTLVDSQSNDATKVRGLCNGCDTQMMPMPFYKCANGCNFILHDWCTRLPTELKSHSPHPRHTLILLLKVRPGTRCGACSDYCNGFAYHCAVCDYYIDVWCALIPRFIVHKSHPYHLFAKLRKRLDKDYCRMCLRDFTRLNETSFSCMLCNFHLHPGCALLLPDITSHKYDKHTMTLTYSPVENHDGDYFCEVCEEELNPNASFYHCQKCAQSMHIACAPLIPQSKAHIHGLPVNGIHETNHVDEEDFISFCKVAAKVTPNLFQNPSSSTNSSTSS